MTCTEFLARHSEYVDGLLDETGAALYAAHADACASCARYDRVVRRGTALVRDLPAVPVSDDFPHRLRHRLYHERDAMARRQPAGASLYAAAIALLVIGGGAWSLALTAQPTPIVDGQVVFAAAPSSSLAVADPPVDATSLVVPSESDRSVALEEEARRAPAAGADEAHVAATGNWPVYSRGVAAVVFHQPSLAIAPVPLRGGVRAVAAPLIVRY